METKTIKIIMILFSLLLSSAGLVAMAQEAQEGLPGIVADVVSQLREEGWSESEIEDFESAAGKLDWEESEGAEPGLVTIALQLSYEGREQLEGHENAALALEIARMAAAMNRFGFEGVDIARTALEGTRDVVQNIDRVREEGIRKSMRKRFGAALERRSRNINKTESLKGLKKINEQFEGFLKAEEWASNDQGSSSY